uniref:Uncharacterized protein n=1 Tax=Physcomitrium patens TaxID=3218 RepID=A0A2K1L7F3_PHYPA|nr:hypothetical protein PHYPA_000377 [Physcomitrium patens]
MLVHWLFDFLQHGFRFFKNKNKNRGINIIAVVFNHWLCFIDLIINSRLKFVSRPKTCIKSEKEQRLIDESFSCKPEVDLLKKNNLEFE